MILSHVPNLDECNRQYGRRYHAILDRYQHIIRWSMYAHIHEEQYQVVTDMTFKKPIGLNFIVGSGTTFMGKPPSFSVLYIDPVTMLPINFETYAFDLFHANQYDDPRWKLMWNYLDTYDLPDLSPQSMHEYSEKIYYYESAATLYKNHRYILGAGASVSQACDYECRMVMYCQTVSNDYDEWQFCRDKNKSDLFDLNESLMTIEQFVNYSWYDTVA